MKLSTGSPPHPPQIYSENLSKKKIKAIRKELQSEPELLPTPMICDQDGRPVRQAKRTANVRLQTLADLDTRDNPEEMPCVAEATEVDETGAIIQLL